MRFLVAIIERLEVSAYTVPTDFPESDGTLEWTSTTLVLVEISAGSLRGLGYTYATRATAHFIRDLLQDLVLGRDALNVTGCWTAMVRAIHNQGRPGVSSMAIAAVDSVLWDLKACTLGLPLVRLLGQVRESVAVYGSGGFTSYPVDQLQRQLVGWVMSGIGRIKMKVGREAQADVARVRAARAAIGTEAELFVDANGAYSLKQALQMAQEFQQSDVRWLEEPVSSDDLEGLREIRDRAPERMEVTAGEYGYDTHYFRRMLEAGAVDVLQADATRCAGITGLLQVAALCETFNVPLSSHTAPSLHLHPCCAIGPVRHMEYFHDHVRIEQRFFDGFRSPTEGRMSPDLDRRAWGWSSSVWMRSLSAWPEWAGFSHGPRVGGPP